MITQTLQLNLVPKGISSRLYVTQYDYDSRTLTFEIYNGSNRFTLTSGTTAKIQGTKPDRHGFSYNAEVDTTNNVITADITQQMTAVDGDVVVEIVLIKNNKRIGTLNFIMVVQPAGLNDDTDISDSDLPDIIAEATEQMLTAEAYAKGTRNGTAVTSGQTGYHDNSKYYKEQAATQASNASTSATNANTNALKAEGYAVGKQNGTTQTSGTYYHNNAQYYKEQAASSATTASTKAGEASTSANTASQKASAASTSAQTASDKALVAEGYAKGTQNGTPVGSTSPYYHNNAEYFKNLANPTVAANVSFNNSGTDMSSTNVQDGIVENRTSIQNLSNQTNAILDNIKYEGVKNLFPFPYYEKTKSGYTVNGNGSIDVNVTTTSSSPSSFNLINNDSSSTWIQDYKGRTLRIAIKSYPTNSDMQMQFTIRDSDNNVLINKTVNGSATDASQSFTVPNDAYNATCQLYIARSKTVQVRAYPLLCDDVLYQADPNWQEPAKSNIALTQETTGLIDNTKANGCVNLLENKATGNANATVNADKTVSISNSSGQTYLQLNDSIYLQPGTYRLSGSNNSGVWLNLYDVTNSEDKGNAGTTDLVFTVTSASTRYRVRCYFVNVTATAKPMISLASMNLSYNDYVPYAKTNRELTEDVTALESQINADTGLIKGVVQVFTASMNVYCTNNVIIDWSNLSTTDATDIAQGIYDLFKKLGGTPSIRFTGLVYLTYYKASDGTKLGSSTDMVDLFSNVITYNAMLADNTKARLSMTMRPYGNAIERKIGLWGKYMTVSVHGVASNGAVSDVDTGITHNTISTYKG